MQAALDNIPDAGLLGRYVAERSEQAFAELVARHVNLVFSAVLRQVGGDPEKAREVSQNVFIELSRQAPRLRDHPALNGWLYTTSRRMAASFIRQEARRRRGEQEHHLMIALSSNDAGERGSWDQLAPVLDDAMHELGETDRRAILLRCFENRPFAEVGTRLGLGENAARMRVERALEKLRLRLNHRGINGDACRLAGLLSGLAIMPAPSALSATLSAVVATASASSAAGSGVFLLNLMSSLNIKVAMGLVVLVAVGTPLLLQQRDRNRLSDENALLRKEESVLRDERLEAVQVADRMRSELERLQRGQQELPRLRGEVALLKQQLAEAGRSNLFSAVARSPSTAAAAMRVFGSAPQDVGSASPEHAVTSMIWAVAAGRSDRVSELLELPKSVSAEDAPKHYAFFTKQMGELFKNMEFTEIQSVEKGDDGRQKLKLQYRDLRTGKSDIFPFFLRLHATGWRVMVEGEVPADFAP